LLVFTTDELAVPLIECENSLSLFLLSVFRPARTEKKGMDNEVVEEVALKSKKRGRAGVKTGGEKSGLVTRKSSRSKGKALA
jgi:hypothetical protein